ncbi:MAG: peptide-methionine (S)-S-oxide reductase MsrA [Bacteroidota bacterium]
MSATTWLTRVSAPVLATLLAWSAALLPGNSLAGELAPGATSRPAASTQTAVFAGGCFWGVDAVFKHVKGVSDVESGYAGGNARTAHYELVSRGDSGHAEAVRIRFNPAEISYRQLLEIFFTVAHDPTQLNRQGPDVGSQYRSAIFFSDTGQQRTALASIEELKAAGAFAKPVVTRVVPLEQFFPAEQYHQNYLALHPREPYIVVNDQPKLEQLRRKFPALYR